MQIGFFMWPRREYILLRLFVNTNVSVESVLLCSATIKNTYDYTTRRLGYLGT